MKKIKSFLSSNLAFYALCAVFVMGMALVILSAAQITPFGNRNLACVDADIQYLDFFSYLKNIFSGEDSVFYTMNKSLGGSSILVFSYYLASPFNIFLLFFDQQHLNEFLSLLFILKISTAAVTCAFFVRNRFPNLRKLYIFLFAVCYAFMQYNMEQFSNIMWLDGVYMLPLILWGVSRAVREQKIIPLAVTVGLSIIFNWYTAGINCIFSILYFVFELVISDNCRFKKNGQYLKKTAKYICGMCLGVGIGSFLFVPTVLATLGGRGTVDSDKLSWALNSNPLNLFSGLTIYSESNQNVASLFCGCFIIMACMAYFFQKDVPFRKKVAVGVFLLVTCSLIFYWQPFFFLFSLLKDASSYWFRYSYVAEIALIFVAAMFCERYSHPDIKVNEHSRKLLKGFLLLNLIFFGMNYLDNNTISLKNIGIEALIGTIVLAVVSLYEYIEVKEQKKLPANILRRCFAVLFVGVLSFEMGLNAFYQIENQCKNKDTKFYKDYITQQQQQIAALKSYDSSFYRINQICTRDKRDNGLTANYNEALAFNYPSISGYTSAPDNIQLDFMNSMGYNSMGNCMSIVNTSMLAADSLLNVKYVLSNYNIKGLNKIESLGVYNNKSVYENPYCLPFSFVYSQSEQQIDSEEQNPFIYQNQLYSRLVGKNVEIYKKIDVVVEATSTSISYTFDTPKDVPVYCYVNRSKQDDNSSNQVNVFVNGIFKTAYARWLGPRVVYVGNDSSTTTVRLNFPQNGFIPGSYGFYYIDLDLLSEVTAEISKKQAEDIMVTNGYVECSVNGQDGELLYLSVPYDKNWTVYRNGEKVTPKLFGDCMMVIPLVDGKNNISMSYSVSGILPGMILTVISLGIIFCLWYLPYRKNKGSVKNNT